MVNYTCYRCGYSNNNKSNIIRHIGRKYPCKSLDNNINLDECKESILNGLNYLEYIKSMKSDEKSMKKSKKSMDSDENSMDSDENSGENEIITKNGKLICKYCKKTFLKKEYLEKHLKKYCKMLVEFNNIYDFDKSKLGKKIYKNNKNAGEIYIIQTDYLNNDHYKIGITTNIRQRLTQYRCACTYEPRLHYYFPCPDIKDIDHELNYGLRDYNIKREIFAGNLENIKKEIIGIINKKFNIKSKAFEPELKIGDLTECAYCDKCFYTSKDLFNHFNICNDYKEYLNKETEGKKECRYCNKLLSCNKSLWRHLKTCKEKKQDEEVKESMTELVQLLNKKLDNQSNQINDFKKELSKRDKELSKRDKQIDELIKKAGINNSHNTINVQNNIKLLSYSDTDRSHLTDKDILKCLKHSNFCIPYLIEKVHFDTNKPENHNVYISNLKNKYVMMYDGNKWKCADRDEQITNLIDDNEGIIEYKLEEWLEDGIKYPEMMKKFNRYIEKKDNDKVINKIKDEIKLLLYNNRNIVNKESVDKVIEVN